MGHLIEVTEDDLRNGGDNMFDNPLSRAVKRHFDAWGAILAPWGTIDVWFFHKEVKAYKIPREAFEAVKDWPEKYEPFVFTLGEIEDVESEN